MKLVNSMDLLCSMGLLVSISKRKGYNLSYNKENCSRSTWSWGLAAEAQQHTHPGLLEASVLGADERTGGLCADGVQRRAQV